MAERARLMDNDHLEEEHELDGQTILGRGSFADEDRYIAYVTLKYVIAVLPWTLFTSMITFLPMSLPFLFADDANTTVGWVLLLVGIVITALVVVVPLPIIRANARVDLANRQLYITNSSIVVKRATPMCCPCWISRSHKTIMASLVTDCVVSQGCIEARYGLSTIQIKNPGQGDIAAHGNDLCLNGFAEPKQFKRLILAVSARARAGQELSTAELEAFRKSGGDYDFAPVFPSNGGGGGGGGGGLLGMGGGAAASASYAGRGYAPSSALNADRMEGKLDAMQTSLDAIADLLAGQARQSPV